MCISPGHYLVEVLINHLFLLNAQLPVIAFGFGVISMTCKNASTQASAQNTLVEEYREADLRKVLDSNPSLGVAFYSAVCLQVCDEFSIILIVCHHASSSSWNHGVKTPVHTHTSDPT